VLVDLNKAYEVQKINGNILRNPEETKKIFLTEKYLLFEVLEELNKLEIEMNP